VVAVNKVDKPGADVSRALNELMKYDLLMEEFGGS
jgi:translation initiation factor IF-2